VQVTAKFGLLAYGFGWLAALGCGFTATLKIGRKLVGNWCAFALDKPSMLG